MLEMIPRRVPLYATAPGVAQPGEDRFATSMSAAGTSAVHADALAFHRECLVLDLHIDTLLWVRLLGYDLTRPHRNRLPYSPFAWHFDLERAAVGGLKACVFGLVINPRHVHPELMFPLKFLAWWERGERGCGFPQTLDTMNLLRDAASARPDRLVFCKSGSEVRRAVAEGRFAGLAALEGAQGIEGRLEDVRAAYAAGLRMLGLVHFQANEAAYPMTVSSFDDAGLTPFGLELISEMERLGMVVDLAHLNPRGVDDALRAMQRPFVVSHTACRALVNHPRNLDDSQIRRIADRGGVVGIAFGNIFVKGGLSGFLDHVEHVIRVGGADAIALGSDFDGMILPVQGMEDVTVYPRITQALLARGQPREVVRKALGENALRVICDVCG
jgi:membrane dipeptidase